MRRTNAIRSFGMTGKNRLLTSGSENGPAHRKCTAASEPEVGLGKRGAVECGASPDFCDATDSSKVAEYVQFL
jgi:hypothetical protein